MKVYLGDSVYAECMEDGTLALMIDNGLGPTNVIFLEPEVWRALIDFMEQGKDNDSTTDQN